MTLSNLNLQIPEINDWVSRQNHPIICNRTGLVIGSITVVKVAGHIPYLSQWKETQALHPLFSLPPTALLNFSKSLWHHVCNFTPDQAADSKLTHKQETLLRVATLAMLHELGDVDQTTVWMPTMSEVLYGWQSILQLSYWKNYLESKRFKFPALRISEFNKGITLAGYLQDCWLVKKEYETHVREAVEREKLEAAEAALKVLRDDLAGKAPRSKKLLWRWFLANIPQKYAKDTDSWMWDLFDAETESEISEFTLADIDLFESIILYEVELGSAVSHAFLERLGQKRKLLEVKFRTFEILIPDSIAAGVADGSISADEPVLADYSNRVKWIVAHSKWKLAHTDTGKHRRDVLAEQSEVTVRTVHEVPDFEDILGREDSDTPALFDLSTGDTPITGETED